MDEFMLNNLDEKWIRSPWDCELYVLKDVGDLVFAIEYSPHHDMFHLSMWTKVSLIEDECWIEDGEPYWLDWSVIQNTLKT